MATANLPEQACLPTAYGHHLRSARFGSNCEGRSPALRHSRIPNPGFFRRTCSPWCWRIVPMRTCQPLSSVMRCPSKSEARQASTLVVIWCFTEEKHDWGCYTFMSRLQKMAVPAAMRAMPLTPRMPLLPTASSSPAARA